MKNFDKPIQIFQWTAALVLLFLLYAVPLPAVIFSPDVFYFYEGATQVRDNTILIQWRREGDSWIEVCQDGRFSRPQFVSPISFRIFRLAKAPMTRSQWSSKVQTFSGSAASAYEDYLRQKAGTALHSFIITIDEAKDRKTHTLPEKGMTGGIIGSNRIFAVDLETGKVRQINSSGSRRKEQVSSQPKAQPVEGHVTLVEANQKLVIHVESFLGIGSGSLVDVFTPQCSNGMSARAGIWKVDTVSGGIITALPVDMRVLPGAYGRVVVYPLDHNFVFEKRARALAASGHKHYAKKEYKMAAKSYAAAAKLGHTPSMLRLGEMCANGQAGPQDMNKVIFWYQKAAKENHVPAIYRLALMAANGEGMPKDLARAVVLFRKGALMRDPKSQYNLGVLYYKGIDGKKDFKQARDWFEKAAHNNIKEAWYALGLMNEKGLGGPVDKDQAKEFYKIALKLGDKRAEKKLQAH